MRIYCLQHTFIIFILSALLLSLSACSILETKPDAKLSAVAERTANLTCGGCHGPNYVPVSFISPNIIGQKKNYLATKIRDFRDTKQNHPYVNSLVAKLTDQDIQNLAAYYANYGQGKNASH
jgi:cytochrome c553